MTTKRKTKKMKWEKGYIQTNKGIVNEIVKTCKILGVNYRVVKLKDGYRVDKNFGNLYKKTRVIKNAYE